MDQIAALTWIKNNIEQFGGDPSNITVFGQSAGAGSIQSLCASPLSKDMVSKAISMSQATDGIDDSEQGLASGLVNTSGQVGAALVLAVVTALVATGTTTGGDGFSDFTPGVNLVSAVAVTGLLLNLLALRRRSTNQTPT